MDCHLLTIVIASFNSGKTISKALRSVSEQSFQNWECLIVDGNSSDNTIEIVKEFANRDSRFHFISEPDSGIYDAFNKGWRKAKGEWIYYLGSDDYLTHDGLEKLMNEVCEDAILSGDVQLIEDGKPSIVVRAAMPHFGNHQGMVMRKSVIESMNGFDENYKIIADYDLMVRIVNAGYQVKIVHVVVANFVMGGTSQSWNNMLVYLRERYRINKKYKAVKYPLLATTKIAIKKYILHFLKKRLVQKKKEDNNLQ